MCGKFVVWSAGRENGDKSIDKRETWRIMGKDEKAGRFNHLYCGILDNYLHPYHKVDSVPLSWSLCTLRSSYFSS